jgi:hypothetical protein
MNPEKPTKKFYQKGWFAAVLILVCVILAFTIGSSDTPAPTASGPSEARTLGQDAYLRLPGNDDPTQALCLAPTKDVYDEYTTALLAKDYQGILDLADKGLFCVHNGSQVKVIGTGVGYTKVRVVQGVAEVDSDKVGEAGWSSSEWVVDR